MIVSNGRHKFRFSEVFLNSNGKTSGSGFVGVIAGLIGCFGFLVSIVGFIGHYPNTLQFMEQTIFFMGVSATLLGVRKIASPRNNGSVQFKNYNTEKNTKDLNNKEEGNA